MPNTQAREKTESSSTQEAELDLRPIEDLVEYMKHYARERPEYCALACLALGFVLGWKLKPW